MANRNFENVRIRTKRDTSANWEKNNPILLNGEEILVDTNAGEVRKKVGNGTKTYTELPFIDEPLRTLIGNKVDKVTGKGLSTEDYTTAEKTKLNGIAAGANNYVHPSNHDASIITQDATHRFVTDAEKTTWNAKASTAVATTAANGLMSKDDKTKLDGIATGAQVNKIDSIILNGTELSIKNKQATIPLADDSTYGAVELVKEFGTAQDNVSSVVTYEFYSNAENAISEELTNIKNRLSSIEEKIKSAIYYA